MEWQPIETAPVDGFEILGFFAGVVAITWFFRGNWEVGSGTVWEPTHWMPLPEPPK